MITVVIPCLNAAKKIVCTVKSLKNGKKFPYEVILADGGSSDASQKKFKTTCQEEGIKGVIISNKNEKCISQTLYKAFQAAEGDFIYQLCAGDLLFDSNWIKDADSFLNKNKSFDGVWARTLLMTEEKLPCKIFPPLAFRNIPCGYQFLKFWLKYNISPPDNTIIIKKSLLLKYFDNGETSKNLIVLNNPHALFNFRLCSNGYNLKFFDRIVHKCFVTKNTRSDKFRKLIKETEKDLKIKKAFYFLNCSKNGTIKVKGKLKKISLPERLNILFSLAVSQLPTYRFFQYTIPELLEFTKKIIKKQNNYWD